MRRAHVCEGTLHTHRQELWRKYVLKHKQLKTNSNGDEMGKYWGLKISNTSKWKKNRTTKRGIGNSYKNTQKRYRIADEVFRNIYFYKNWVASRLLIMGRAITFNFSTWFCCSYVFFTKRNAAIDTILGMLMLLKLRLPAVPLKTNSSNAEGLVFYRLKQKSISQTRLRLNVNYPLRWLGILVSRREYHSMSEEVRLACITPGKECQITSILTINLRSYLWSI